MEPIVCDFGYARALDTQADSGTTKSEVGPVKWMVRNPLISFLRHQSPLLTKYIQQRLMFGLLGSQVIQSSSQNLSLGDFL